MFKKQTKRDKARLALKAIKHHYKARRLTREQRDFMLRGLEQDL